MEALQGVEVLQKDVEVLQDVGASRDVEERWEGAASQEVEALRPTSADGGRREETRASRRIGA